MTVTLGNGYTMTTTLIDDFAFADNFGAYGIEDTYKRTFRKWKNNIVYLAEMVVALGLLGWKHYREGRPS